MTNNTPNTSKKIDMSSAAIGRRLREVAQLYRLGMSLQKAKRLGKVKDLKSSC